MAQGTQFKFDVFYAEASKNRTITVDFGVYPKTAWLGSLADSILKTEGGRGVSVSDAEFGGFILGVSRQKNRKSKVEE